MKPSRLDGEQWSLVEADSLVTKKWTKVIWRIMIGLDDVNDLIILDGRHLLHAFVVLNKRIPQDVVWFNTHETYLAFIQAYSWSVIY